MNKTRYATYAAITAALYAAITLATSFMASGPIQFRVAEAMCVLPAYTTASIPGLFIGCILANLIGGYGVWDVVVGSAATLLAALVTYALRRRSRFLWPLPSVLFNAFMVGAMLTYLSSVGGALWFNVLSVGAGQLLACYLVGIPLTYGLDRTRLFEGGQTR